MYAGIDQLVLRDCFAASVVMSFRGLEPTDFHACEVVLQVTDKELCHGFFQSALVAFHGQQFVAAARYDKTARNVFTFLHLAATMILLA